MMEENRMKKKFPELRAEYVLDKTIGSGGFGKVKLAYHILTGEKVAIKIMDKKLLNEDLPRVQQEFLALKTLQHPNICKLLQFIESDTHFFLIMEYCSGGELFDHIVEREKLTEAEARIFFRQIVSAIAHCHNQGFAHRDLKPENILLDQVQNLKLIDFGLCIRPGNGEYLETSCGSPNYAAPELLKGDKYLGERVDVWSLGVILYALLCGFLPFDHQVTNLLYKKIISGQYEEPEFLSEDSKHFIKSMLQVDPTKRITTAELCSHKWMKQGSENTLEDMIKKYEALPYDIVCLRRMSRILRQSSKAIWSDLMLKKFDHNYATYHLLISKKRRVSPSIPNSLEERSVRKSLNGSGTENCLLPTNDTYRVLQNSRKRARVDNSCDAPTKVAVSQNRTPVISSPCSTNKTPDRIRTPISAKKVFGHLRAMFTPSRSSRDEPALLTDKQLSNVTCTSSKNPEDVLNLLHSALVEKGVVCSVKGYTVRGKLKKSSSDKNCKLSFELEICIIAKKEGDLVGIRRKRLKGDAWNYKSICEEILAIASK